MEEGGEGRGMREEKGGGGGLRLKLTSDPRVAPISLSFQAKKLSPDAHSR